MTENAERMARAGDYVLGLMDTAARERAERDLETDAAFRDCVARLAVRLAALDRTAAEEPIPDGLWRGVEARIADMPHMRAAIPTTQADPLLEREATRVIDARQRIETRRNAAASLGGWRGYAIAASLLAACGIGYLGGRMSTPGAEPIVVVVLSDEQNVPGAIVEAYGDDRVRIVPLTAFEVPEGKILQAWTLYDRAVGPISLGTFATAREIRLQGPDTLPVPVADQLYEITLEDAPGSTAGRPLGPILVKGLAKRPAV